MTKKIDSKTSVKEKKVRAFTKYLRISPQKLNIVAKLIRGLKVEQALKRLSFSKKRISYDIKKLLMSAVANAQNNHGLDIDGLFVSEAFVGKSIVMKRLMYKSKGKGEQMHKPFSNMTIILSEEIKNVDNKLNKTQEAGVK